MLIAMGAWAGPTGGCFVMHSWEPECVEELVRLLTGPWHDGGLIDVERRVAEREYARMLDGLEHRNTRPIGGVYAPGRPAFGAAGHMRPVNRMAQRVIGREP